MRIATAVMITLIVILALAASASARTWYIRPDGSGDAPTIQAGIDSSAAGDTVLVACGIYYEHDIAMKSGICLRSETGDASCAVVDGQAIGRVFYCDGVDNTSAIEDLTIANGFASDPDINGGGMYCINSSLRIVACAFENNVSDGGGGAMFCHTSPVHIEGCVFTRNTAGNSGAGPGGAVSCPYSSAEIVDCRFVDNSCKSNGGALDFSCCSPSINNCVFIGNTADVGGGVSSYGCDSSPFITGCLFKGNSAVTWGGGLACFGSTFPEVIDCIFVSNSTDGEGGGLFFGWSSPVVRNCTISGNSAGDGGGGIGLRDARYTIDNSIIAFSTSGEAISCLMDNPGRLTCCDIYGNAGGDWVECIYFQYGQNGDFSADPKFCDRRSGNFMLCENSPCVPGNHPQGADCSLIGAFGVGCGPTAVEYTTWGRIKSMFR